MRRLTIEQTSTLWAADNLSSDSSFVQFIENKLIIPKGENFLLKDKEFKYLNKLFTDEQRKILKFEAEKCEYPIDAAKFHPNDQQAIMDRISLLNEGKVSIKMLGITPKNWRGIFSTLEKWSSKLPAGVFSLKGLTPPELRFKLMAIEEIKNNDKKARARQSGEAHALEVFLDDRNYDLADPSKSTCPPPYPPTFRLAGCKLISSLHTGFTLTFPLAEILRKLMRMYGVVINGAEGKFIGLTFTSTLSSRQLFFYYDESKKIPALRLTEESLIEQGNKKIELTDSQFQLLKALLGCEEIPTIEEFRYLNIRQYLSRRSAPSGRPASGRKRPYPE